MTFKERLRTALEAMPDKRLGKSFFYNATTECHCALGALMRHEKLELNWDTFRAIGAEYGKEDDLEDAMIANDRFGGSNTQRHAHVLEWAKA